MESIKLKQFIYLCTTSCVCGLIFGLVTHENWKDAGKISVVAVASSVAAFWVVKREDLQERLETHLVDASFQVKTNIDKVKNQIQGKSNSLSSSRKAISSPPPKKALPDRQTSSQKTNPVAYQDLPPENTVQPNFSNRQNQQQIEPEYDSLVGKLQQLQEKNSGLKDQLQELQEQNQDLQSQLELSDEQRQEWNQALESLDEQSQLLNDRPNGEQVGLEALLDEVPSLDKQKLSQQNKNNSVEEENKFDEALTQFSLTLQPPGEATQTPPEQKTPPNLSEEKPKQERGLDELSNELVDELEDLVEEDSAIQSNLELGELEELPNELADELENMVVDNSDDRSPIQSKELDPLAQLSQELQLPEDNLDKLNLTEDNNSILSKEQTELEQLFGKTPDRSDSDRNK